MPPISLVVVDDAEEMRALIALSLRLTGQFDLVGEGANGRDAVDLAARERPGLMLLDLSMPVMDGLEALPLVRQESPETVVVVFSAFDDQQLGREARKLGAAAYVEKGVPIDELAKTLVAVYEEHRAAP
jgi:hypothetical protein